MTKGAAGHVRVAAVLLVLCCTAPGAVLAGAPAGAAASRADTARAGVAEAPPASGERIDVIVSYERRLPRVARLAVDAAAAAEGAVVFASGAGFAASLTEEQITELRLLPGIAGVTPNRVLEPAAGHHVQTGAERAWAAGLRGDGQVIVVIDTGVDTSNPNLAGKVVAEACFTPVHLTTAGPTGDCPDGSAAQVGPGAAAPCTGRSPCAHGTAVTSVAAAAGPEVWGTAPGAAVIAVQVFGPSELPDDRVITDEASLVRALEWVEQVVRDRPVAAVNLSLGGAPIPTPCAASPALVDVIDRLAAAGTPVVASAGNQGDDTRLSFPACLPNIVSVGAEGSPGAPAAFANRSPSLSLFAPGEAVEVAWSDPCCARTMSGSSFAAPQVAAAFALLAQQGGHGPVADRLALLQRTGDPVLVLGPVTWDPVPANALRIDRALDARYAGPPTPGLARRASPIGALDVAERVPGGLRVVGWALDADTVAPATVHVYVDGRLARSATAGADRPDVAAAFRGYGPSRGFDVVVPAGPDPATVCVYGIDRGAGNGNSLIACRLVEAPTDAPAAA